MMEGSRIRSAEIVKVIRVVHLAGCGVTGDPAREIVSYYKMDGTFLAEDDPTERIEAES